MDGITNGEEKHGDLKIKKKEKEGGKDFATFF